MSMQGRHKTGQALMHAILVVVAIYTLAPLVFLIFNSFKSNNEIVDSPVSAPSSWSFQYIISAAQQIHFFRAIWITFVITIISVLLLVMVSSLAAWVMVRSKSILGTVLYLGFTAAMLIPFQSLMYPLLDLFEKIGLKNIPGLIFMYGGFGLSMSVFLYHGFIKSVPASLEEAAVLEEEPPQAVRTPAAATTPAAVRKLRREIIFFIIQYPPVGSFSYDRCTKQGASLKAALLCVCIHYSLAGRVVQFTNRPYFSGHFPAFYVKATKKSMLFLVIFSFCSLCFIVK
mgnify:CR=1 FL=1